MEHIRFFHEALQLVLSFAVIRHLSWTYLSTLPLHSPYWPSKTLEDVFIPSHLLNWYFVTCTWSFGLQQAKFVVLLLLLLLLPRDAMRQRSLCCRPVSVRLSVTLVYSIQTTEDIVKRLSRPGSAMILVFFWSRAPILNSQGNPFSGGAKHNGVVKFWDFRRKSPSISETVRDRPMVAVER